MDVIEFTRKLIDIPSLTGDEQAVGLFVASHLESLGYLVEKQEVTRDRFNILARTNDPARVVFSTHLDTVPPFIPSSEDDEYIYGRGACDAKGIIASQIFAAESLRRDGKDDIGFLFTVDEELASVGAQLANKHPMASECEFLINGEPTDNLVAVGTKGSMRVILTTAGRAAHSAYPEEGDSAINKLIEVLVDLKSLDWPHDGFFGETTCNIGLVSGGTRPNVIADAARAELQLRLVQDKEATKALVREAVGERAQIEFASAHNPVRLFSLAGFAECVVRFTTDIPYLSNWGKPLLIGPGSILVAHTEHEKVSKKELLRAIDLYVSVASAVEVSTTI
ncbi:MAG TPA: M20/M25/M40 family metallo-hydrolase [Pyrinomonadaceae bacterium]|nr:M20/M25/M40 family metallo-hydrolase [Pyrinomonadaceae bacterium]